MLYPVPVANPGNDKMITNYCPIDPYGNERDASNSWPDGLQDGLRRWSEFQVPSDTLGGSSPPEATLVCEDHRLDQLEIVPGGRATYISGALHNNDKKNCLVAQLADAGAVLLPYSHAGATLGQQPSGPVFDFHTYDGSTTKQDPSTSVQKLDDELSSIHSVWKDTHIVVVGHSYGGLIAEQWWEAIRVTHNHPRGVVHVFSLDSPINGVDHCLLATVLYDSAISQKWCKLWDGRQTRDPILINLDTDATFPYTAIGTPSDPTYGGLPNGGGDLEAQILYNYNQCNPQQDKQCRSPQPPSYVLGAPNAPDCVGGGKIYNTTGHDIVKVCPQVVKFIDCSVVAARDNGNQQACYPGAGSATPTPTASSSGGEPNTADLTFSGGINSHVIVKNFVSCSRPDYQPTLSIYPMIDGKLFDLRVIFDNSKNSGSYNINDFVSAAFQQLQPQDLSAKWWESWSSINGVVSTLGSAQLTFSDHGKSGTLDLVLAPDPSNPRSPLHITGSWVCLSLR